MYYNLHLHCFMFHSHLVLVVKFINKRVEDERSGTNSTISRLGAVTTGLQLIQATRHTSTKYNEHTYNDNEQSNNVTHIYDDKKHFAHKIDSKL